MDRQQHDRKEARTGNMRNCCTTTLSHLEILKNDFIKSLLSVLVFELCFFEAEFKL
jgi:hypothetical protein